MADIICEQSLIDLIGLGVHSLKFKYLIQSVLVVEISNILTSSLCKLQFLLKLMLVHKYIKVHLTVVEE